MGCGTVRTTEEKVVTSLSKDPQQTTPIIIEDQHHHDEPVQNLSQSRSRMQFSDIPPQKQMSGNPLHNRNLTALSNNGHLLKENTAIYYDFNFNYNNATKVSPALPQHLNIDMTSLSINPPTPQLASNTNEDGLSQIIEASSDSTSIIIAVQASRFEVMYPIWIERHKVVKFEVKGLWKADKFSSDVTAEGVKRKDPKYKFNHGCLIGRVVKADFFAITDGLEYTCEESGPLMMKINLNNLQSSPSGSLKVKISGAEEMALKTIDEKIGWDKALQSPNMVEIKEPSSYTIPELEKMTLTLINKIRYNPSLFAIQYLENIAEITPSTKEMYTYLKNSEFGMKALNFNIKLTNDLQSFFEPILTKSLLEENQSNKKFNIQSSLGAMEEYLRGIYPAKILRLFLKRHEDGKPLSLAIRFLLDDKMKNQIFNMSNTEIGMVTLLSMGFKEKYYVSVIVFSQDEMKHEGEEAKKRDRQLRELFGMIEGDTFKNQGNANQFGMMFTSKKNYEDNIMKNNAVINQEQSIQDSLTSQAQAQMSNDQSGGGTETNRQNYSQERPKEEEVEEAN